MTFATVRGAAEHAAKQGKLSPHQLAALSALDEALTDAQRQAFTDAWRSEGSPAAAPNPFAAVNPLLDLIAAGEGDYDSVNRGKAGDTPAGWPGLEKLTIGAVQQLQRDRTLFAVGRYQFIPETLRMALEAAGFSASDLFSPETQDWLAVALLLGGKRPVLRDYLLGKNVSIEAAQLDLAKEWASIPQANGRGVYDGDSAGNRATAKVTRVQSALKAARAGLAGRTLPQLRLPDEKPAKPAGQTLLTVPFFSQHDNASGQGFRECASSSAAMVAAFWGKVANDDSYNQVRAQFGDTTNLEAQVQALRKLGLDARFRSDATPATIEAELRAGRPVMVGWLHQGPSTAPTGGGHWSVVIGCDSGNWIHNDPNGEADLVRGGYVNRTGGKGVRYSRKNWNPRWLPDGKGWCVLVQPLKG